MRKSARLLGHELGMLNAREVNALLKQEGYLEGEPDAYGLTEKGRRYGSEEDHHRGTGGYASYNRDWTTRTWDDAIVSELRQAMANSAGPAMAGGAALTDASVEGAAGAADVEADDSDFDYEVSEDDDPPLPPLWAIAAVVGGIAVAQNPHVRRWVRETAQPRAMRLWRKATRRGPAIDAPAQPEAPARALEAVGAESVVDGSVAGPANPTGGGPGVVEG